MHFGRRLAALCTGLAGLVGVAALSGCIDPAESASEASTVGTVGGVGQLPELSDPSPSPSTDSTSSEATSTTEPLPTTPVALTVGQQVQGNRLLMIGDSLMASISQRYGGQACEALVPLGWQVEVDAETGRFIDFGKIVLDKRLDAGWDAAVLFLGNNYGQDQFKFEMWLHSTLLTLVPRPTVLLTVTEYRPQQVEVNEVIRQEAAKFDNVTVIDWATISEAPGLTGDDGLHLSEAGRIRLGYTLADTMGQAPVTPGKCLSTSFRNDSAGSPNGPTGGSKSGSTPGKSGTTATTAKPTATTVKPATTPTTVRPTVTTVPTQPTTPPPQTTQAPLPPTTPPPSPPTTQP